MVITTRQGSFKHANNSMTTGIICIYTVIHKFNGVSSSRNKFQRVLNTTESLAFMVSEHKIISTALQLGPYKSRIDHNNSMVTT